MWRGAINILKRMPIQMGCYYLSAFKKGPLQGTDPLKTEQSQHQQAQHGMTSGIREQINSVTASTKKESENEAKEPEDPKQYSQLKSLSEEIQGQEKLKETDQKASQQAKSEEQSGRELSKDEKQMHSAAQLAILNKLIIQTILEEEFPKDETDLNNYTVLSQLCKKVEINEDIEKLFGMKADEKVREQVISAYTIGKGVMLKGYLRKQNRVKQAQTSGFKAVFFPTVSMTQQIFKRIMSGGSYIQAGCFGTSKTWALLQLAHLCRPINSFYLQYGHTEFGRKVIGKYKLNEVPVMIYYSLTPQDLVKNFKDQILKQVSQELADQLKDLNLTAGQFINQIGLYYQDKGLGTRFVFDQINTYFSWAREYYKFEKRGGKGRNMPSQIESQLSLIKQWTPFLVALRDCQSMFVTFNSSANWQRYLANFCRVKQFFHLSDTHESIKQKNLQIISKLSINKQQQKELAMIYWFNIELYANYSEGSSIKEKILKHLQKKLSSEDRLWPPYVNFVGIREFVKQNQHFYNPQTFSEQQHEECLRQLKKFCLSKFREKNKKFQSQSPIEMLAIMGLYMSMYYQIKRNHWKEGGKSTAPISIPIQNLCTFRDTNQTMLKEGDPRSKAVHYENIMARNFPDYLNKEFFTIDESGKNLVLYITPQEAIQIISDQNDKVLELFQVHPDYDKGGLLEITGDILQRVLLIAIQEKFLLQIQFLGAQEPKIDCRNFEPFKNMTTTDKLFSLMVNLQKLTQNAKSKGSILGLPETSKGKWGRTNTLFDMVDIKYDQRLNETSVNCIDLTYSHETSNLKEKATKALEKWKTFRTGKKEFKLIERTTDKGEKQTALVQVLVQMNLPESIRKQKRWEEFKEKKGKVSNPPIKHYIALPDKFLYQLKKSFVHELDIIDFVPVDKLILTVNPSKKTHAVTTMIGFLGKLTNTLLIERPEPMDSPTAE